MRRLDQEVRDSPKGLHVISGPLFMGPGNRVFSMLYMLFLVLWTFYVNMTKAKYLILRDNLNF